MKRGTVIIKNYPSGRLTPKESGVYTLGLSSDDGSRLYLGGKILGDKWGDYGIITKLDTLKLEAGREYNLKVEFYENGGGAAAILGWQRIDVDSIANAVVIEQQKALELARTSDVVLLCVGNTADIET